MSDNDDDDATPAGRTPIIGGPDATDIANAGIALATIATRLRHQADLADAASERCREAARMGVDFSAKDRGAAFRDIEDDICVLADALHDTRRVLTSARMASKEQR